MDRGFVKTRTASTNYLYNLTLTYRRFLGFPALGKIKLLHGVTNPRFATPSVRQ
jgi:hypothetical protein